MTPPPDELDREIASALSGINLQSLGNEEKEAAETAGERLWTGTIQGINGDDVIVDIGPRVQGIVSRREFEEDPVVGATMSFALRGREEGLWLLSLTGAKEVAAWNDLTVGSHVRARVSGQNKGGLELIIGKNRAFMPASQVAIGREEDIARFIGQTLLCEVLEIDRSKDRVLLSRRKVLETERNAARTEAVGSLQVGAITQGKVTRVEPFGGFVDLGNGLEGLLHVSNLSHQRIEDASTELTQGQELKVKILDIKDGGKRIGLGIKQLLPDPWDDVHERFPADREVTGKVTRLADFGAFIELAPGLDGLLHVSQLGRDRVRRAGDVLSMGEEVTVRVSSVDISAKRISLTRLDSRGAVLGSEDAVDGDVIDKNLAGPGEGNLGTNLGNLFRDALKKNNPDK
jgi:small subunit ribosomal protein S1